MEHLTAQDVMRAATVLRLYLRRTPLYSYPALDRLCGARLYVKHENHSPIGSFKARGAITALAGHPDERRVIACSSGNHGMGVTYAAWLLSREATVVVPEWANPEKTRAIEALGGRVVRHGTSIADAQRRTRELVEAEKAYFADDGGDPLIAAGAGTVALEMLEEVPDLEMLVVPMGDGALAGGCGVVTKALTPDVAIIGVQAEACPALVRSWQAGRVVPMEGQTLADGLASVEPHATAVALLRRVLDDAVLVSEADLLQAIRIYLEVTHNLAEGAGAAALAACLRLGGKIAGKRVGVILSGGNLDTRLLSRVVTG